MHLIGTPGQRRWRAFLSRERHTCTRRHGYAHDIVFDDDPRVEEALTEKEDGLGLSDRFFCDEWREVAQAQGIAAEEDYLRAPRSGRGQALNRIRRRQVWTVLAAYQAALAARSVKESVDAMRDLRRLLENGEVAGLHRHIVVDEAQEWAPKRSGCCAAWQARSARTTCSSSATGTSGSTAGAPRLAPAASTSVAAAESCA
jgi:hypothetical protein